jgi:hypothetical protein
MMSWVLASTGDSRKTYRILVKKPIGQVHLEDKEEDGRMILIWS